MPQQEWDEVKAKARERVIQIGSINGTPIVLRLSQYPLRRGELAQFQYGHRKINKKSDVSQIP